MGKEFKVRYTDLDQLQQLFTRQQGHMTKIQTYVTTNCAASGAFDGPVLGLLADHYSGAYESGKKGFGNGATIAETCSTKIGTTKSSLVTHEKEQIKAYNKKAKQLGLEPQSYTPPEGVPLGPPVKGSEPASAGPGSSAYDTVMTINGAATKAVDYGSKAATTLGDPLGLTKGDEPPRWGDYVDPKYWVGTVKSRGVDAIVNGGRGTTLPDGTHISQSDLNESRRRHQIDSYDRHYSNGAENVYRHLDPDSTRQHSYTPGSIWDDDTGRRAHRTAGDLTSAVSAPGEVVSSVKGLVDAGKDLNDAIDLHHDVTDAEHGPSNDGSINWAKNGDGW